MTKIAFELSADEVAQMAKFFGVVAAKNAKEHTAAFKKFVVRPDFADKLSSILKSYVLDESVEWEGDDYKYESDVWEQVTAYCNDAGVKTIYDD